MAEQGTLYIIAAPSGAGKTSLVNALIKSADRLQISISYTTRQKRPNEKDKVNYFFVDEKEFKQLITQDHFLEHADVFGEYYGTPKQWVQDKLAQGIDVILEIDWQGTCLVKKQIKDCMAIFILPPSWETLKQRLLDRAQDDLKTIEKRLKEARNEVKHIEEFDYLVINDDFDTALADLMAIIRAKRLLLPTQRHKHTELLSKWL